MEEVLHANIFFFITGVAVIIFTALLCVALFHLIKILRTFRRILDRVEEGTEVIAEDMQHIRAYLTEGGLFQRIMRTLMGSSKGGASRERKGQKHERKKTELSIKDET